MKRQVAMLAICVFVGATLNIVVAWTLIKTCGFGPTGAYDRFNKLTDSHHQLWGKLAPDDFPRLPDGLDMPGGRLGCQAFTLTTDDISTQDSVVTRYMHAVYAGWPALTLAGYAWAEITYSSIEGDPVPRGRRRDHYSMGFFRISIPWLTRGRGIPERYPFRVLWGGALLNTAFFGALVWVCLLAAFAVRRRLTMTIRSS